MKLTKLLENLEYKPLQGSMDIEISHVENDSRKIKPNGLFFCIPGAKWDGHDFAGQVAEAGATAIVVEHPVEVPENVTVIQVKSTRYAMAIISSAFYDYPSKKLKVIGVTGTKGKTTTTYMIKSMLEQMGYKTGLVGTNEVYTGKEAIVADRTTPESLVLQRYMADMVEYGMECMVMEVSSQGLMLDRVAGIDFDYGIFTNLSPDHIGENEHKTYEEYRMWKSKLFTMCKVGILNMDDKEYVHMLEGHTCEVLRIGTKGEGEYQAIGGELYRKKGALGIEFTLSGNAEALVRVNMPGEFSIYNALCALAVAHHMGMPLEQVVPVLEQIKVRGRVEMVPVSEKFTVLIDYAHNAVSLESILRTLREYQPTRLISVFGCGGNRAKSRRYEMGETSGHLADLTIITSDNPRFEEPEEIIEDILIGMNKTKGQYVKIIDRKEAFRYALVNAQEGDIIVLAGKGHEDYQEIKGVKHHMDERELVKEVMEEENGRILR